MIFSVFIMGILAQECDPGFYSPTNANNICIKCPPGTFKNIKNDLECSPCKNSYYQDEFGQTDCKYCNFKTIGTTGCLPFEYFLLPFFVGLVAALMLLSLIYLVTIFKSRKLARKLDIELASNSFDPPTKRALELLNKIRPKLEKKADILRQMDQAIELVKNTGRANNPISRYGADLDDDFKVFLLNSGFGDTSSFKKPRNRSRKNTTEDKRNSFSVVSSSNTNTKSFLSTSQEELGNKINLLATKVFNLHDFKSVEQMMTEARDSPWHFDIFKFADLTNNHPIVFMGYFLLKRRNLLTKFQLRDQNVLKFFDEVELSYNDNPYHSNIHAADIMYTFASLIHNSAINDHITDREAFSTILACSIHDLGHPGVSNMFLIRSKDPLALLYSDQSVLEYHHCHQGFEIALLPEHNLFCGCAEDEYLEIRKLIIDLILATDMSKHFDLLNKFKNMNAINPKMASELHMDEYRRVLLIITIKCADLSNPAKPAYIYQEWCSRVMEEFFIQGDLEKNLNLPVSKFMDRENCDVAKCQVV
eukprot:NODE_82_length_22625_cov_0.476516.p4 type:complete len:533 gc:universal NODE_82_length_22625_cov_0.476516:10192-11790(+)